MDSFSCPATRRRTGYSEQTMGYKDFREQVVRGNMIWQTEASNKALERTATRLGSTFFIAKRFSVRATPSPGGRRSAPSR